ncbi:hypothetical protein L6452_18550 [Arctium lappa]|uniref:Uncharacterized protein n=1 Tax=Arctium lappa TaxID=4217 RepID=A0ACB9C6J1_ARCLA|nr:hypothetical protein L6452_18550 [Arctium lappa]
MSKNMAQEDVNDIFATLSQHEDEVNLLREEKKMVKDSLALLADKKKGSSSSSVSGSKSKLKKSKAYLTILLIPVLSLRLMKLRLILLKIYRGLLGTWPSSQRNSTRALGKRSIIQSTSMKNQEEGKVLMAEEENWSFQSSDEEDANFTQVCVMAKVNEDVEAASEQSEGHKSSTWNQNLKL